MKINRPGALPSGADSLEPLENRDIKSTPQPTTKPNRFSEMLSGANETQSAEHAASGLAPESSNVPAGNNIGVADKTRQALQEIARQANLSNPEAAHTALRESAEFMIRARLGEHSQESEQSQHLVEELSEFVATDPLLKAKLLRILTKIKAE